MAQFELRGEASTFTEDMYAESRAIRFKQDNPENFRTQTTNLAQKTEKPPVAPSLVLDNFLSPYNASLVQRCQDQGVVVIGKINLMGNGTIDSYVGPTR